MIRLILLLLLLPLSAHAADPPLWSAFQSKITDNIQTAIYTGSNGTSGLEAEYAKFTAALAYGPPYTYKSTWSSATAYAVGDVVYSGGAYWIAAIANTNVTPATGATWKTWLTNLASSPTYYDGARVLWNLAEIFSDNAAMVSHFAMAADDIASSYLYYQFPASGYTHFPHGLYLNYVHTGSTKPLSALASVRDQDNFHIPSAVDEDTIYSREIAYSIQTYIWANKAGVANTHPEYLTGMVNYAISHLNQWHTGVWYSANTTHQYRQAFMAGLTMAALIEYYEFVYQDPRIPPLIKATCDDLWADHWVPDLNAPPSPYDTNHNSTYAAYVPGYGGFKYWSNWSVDHYVWDYSHNASSANANADDNMLIGPAYIWYYLYSGDATYKARAVDIWEGWVVSGFVGYDKQFNQGMRWTYDFLRWYRKGTGETCGSGSLPLCTTQSACTAAGGNWGGVLCQKLSVASLVAPPPTTTRVINGRISGRLH